MPVVGATAYATARDALELARALLNDIDFPQSAAIITPTGAVRASNVVTITTTAAHGFTAGQRVTIEGVTDSSFNGTQTIATVPSSTTFTYAQTTANASSGNGTATLVHSGDVFTDGVLLPLVKAAYRKTQRRLLNAGHKAVESEFDLLLKATDTSFGDTISGNGSDALPVDFLAPQFLWERPAGTSTKFFPMHQRDVIPDWSQSTTLRVWSWREDMLWFVGATQDTDVRLRYFKSLADLVNADSPILLRGGLDLVAYETAMLAAASKGASAPAMWETMHQDAITEFLNLHALAGQFHTVRRKPYGGRQRSRWGVFG